MQWRKALPWLFIGIGLTLSFGLTGCSDAVTLPPPTLSPSSDVQCIPWYEAPDHLGKRTCVEGRILEVHAADTPNPRFASFVFDPNFSDFDYIYGKFYAWVHCDDWSEYFSDGHERGAFSTELDGTCAHVFGTIEQRWGSRIRIAVTKRSQIEIIDCAACQNPQACAPPQTPTPLKGHQGDVLLVIAPSGFNDDEFAETRALLESKGYDVIVASNSPDIADGDYGLLEVKPNLTLTNVNVANYEALVFIGGRGSTIYWDHAEAHRLAREAAAEGKVLAATSLAPVILARAGVMVGKEATVYDPATHCPELETEGAICTGERVERDGRLVTARLEQAAKQFAETIVEALREP